MPVSRNLSGPSVLPLNQCVRRSEWSKGTSAIEWAMRIAAPLWVTVSRHTHPTNALLTVSLERSVLAHFENLPQLNTASLPRKLCKCSLPAASVLVHWSLNPTVSPVPMLRSQE